MFLLGVMIIFLSAIIICWRSVLTFKNNTYILFFESEYRHFSTRHNRLLGGGLGTCLRYESNFIARAVLRLLAVFHRRHHRLRKILLPICFCGYRVDHYFWSGCGTLRVPHICHLLRDDHLLAFIYFIRIVKEQERPSRRPLPAPPHHCMLDKQDLYSILPNRPPRIKQIMSTYLAFTYPVLTHWGWTPTGWMAAGLPSDHYRTTYIVVFINSAKNVHTYLDDFQDFAGSGLVHLCGGTISFVAAYLMGPRIGRFPENGSKDSGEIKGHSVPVSTVSIISSLSENYSLFSNIRTNRV